MTIAQLKSALYTWVSGVTGWTAPQVIFSHPNAPRPDLDYLEIEILAQVDNGGQGYRDTDLDGDLVTYSWETVSVRIQGFGADGWDKLNALRIALKGVTHREALNAAGLTRRGPVPELQRVPAIVGTRFEERGTTTFRFGVVQSDATSDAGISYVDTVNYTLNVYDEAGDPAVSESFTAEEE